MRRPRLIIFRPFILVGCYIFGLKIKHFLLSARFKNNFQTRTLKQIFALHYTSTYVGAYSSYRYISLVYVQYDVAHIKY
jgi:hypothetical protein